MCVHNFYRYPSKLLHRHTYTLFEVALAGRISVIEYVDPELFDLCVGSLWPLHITNAVVLLLH